jgi:hypothetical protein
MYQYKLFQIRSLLLTVTVQYITFGVHKLQLLLTVALRSENVPERRNACHQRVSSSSSSEISIDQDIDLLPDVLSDKNILRTKVQFCVKLLFTI